MSSSPESTGQTGEAAEMLPAVYDELKKLANAKMSHENPQTIGPTALVHEAYLRLLKPEDKTQFQWSNHSHFFSAAAEAMRRIMIDRARARNADKRGKAFERDPQNVSQIQSPVPDDEIIEIGEALEAFAELEPEIANAVKLKFFVGLKWEEIAEVTGISVRKLRRQWTYARSWLHAEIQKREN